MARFIDVDVTPSTTIDARGMFAWLLAVAMLAGAALASLYAVDATGRKALADNRFASYYCAGGILRSRSDPYTTSPQSSCEHAGTVVAPAPLPGYVLAPFAVASFAPFRYALIGWEALLFLAIVATVWAMRELTDLPRIAIAAAVLATESAGSLAYGQLAAIAVLGVALCGLFIARNAPRAAAYASVLALALPQFGFPVVVAMFFFVPRSRWTLLLVLAILGAGSYALLGADQNIEFLRYAIRAHLTSELTSTTQYSLSWVLNFFRDIGTSEALKIGALQYAGVTLLAVLFAPRVARALEAPAALVFFPAMAAAIGGASAHDYDLAFAIPFALVLASRGKRLDGIAWFALALLAVPWIAWQVRYAPELLAIGAVAVAIVTIAGLEGRPWLGRVVVALGAVGLLLGIPWLMAELPAAGQILAGHAPGWLALALLLVAGLAAVPPRLPDDDEDLQMSEAF